MDYAVEIHTYTTTTTTTRRLTCAGCLVPPPSPQDYDTISEFARKNWEVELKREQLHSKGGNWGDFELKGDHSML